MKDLRIAEKALRIAYNMLSIDTFDAKMDSVRVIMNTNLALQTKRQAPCSLLNKHWPTIQDRNNAIKKMEAPFYEIPEEEKVIPGYAHKAWDAKPFFSDYSTFTDSDLDMMTHDNFTQQTLNLSQHKLRNLDLETANVYLKNIRTALISNLEKNPAMIKSAMKQHKHLLAWAEGLLREDSDKKYDWLLNKKLAAAMPPMHSQDLGQAGSLAAKFHEGEHDDNQTSSYGQLSRMVWEDCKMASGEIKIPQMTQPGACSIPSYLRIEDMQKFMGLDLNQATVLAKIYRILNMGYKEVIATKIGTGDNRMSLNNHIKRFVKAGNGQPWDIIVAPGKSLLALAQEVKALLMEDQEDPEWAKEDHFVPGNIGVTYTKGEFADHVHEYIMPVATHCDRYEGDDILEPHQLDEGTNVWLSMNGEHYSIIRDEEDKERQFDQQNPVNMYTYNNLSQIPKAAHLLGHNVKLFVKALNKLQAGDITKAARKKATKWVEAKGTWAQKAFWENELKRMRYAA